MLRTINCLMAFLLVAVSLSALEVSDLKTHAEKVNPGLYDRYFTDQAGYETRYFQLDIVAGIASETKSKSLKPLHDAILSIWIQYVFAGKKVFSSLDEVKGLLNNQEIHIQKRSMLLDIMYFETRDCHFMAEFIARYPWRVDIFLSTKDRDFENNLRLLLAREFEERRRGWTKEEDFYHGAAIRIKFIEFVKACLFQSVSEELMNDLFRSYPLIKSLSPSSPSDKMVFDAIKGHGDRIFSKFQRALMSTEEGRTLLSIAIKDGIVDKTQAKNIKFLYDSETTKAIFGNE